MTFPGSTSERGAARRKGKGDEYELGVMTAPLALELERPGAPPLVLGLDFEARGTDETGCDDELAEPSRVSERHDALCVEVVAAEIL